jgi:hypothetical protein
VHGVFDGMAHERSAACAAETVGEPPVEQLPRAPGLRVGFGRNEVEKRAQSDQFGVGGGRFGCSGHAAAGVHRLRLGSGRFEQRVDAVRRAADPETVAAEKVQRGHFRISM